MGVIMYPAILQKYERQSRCHQPLEISTAWGGDRGDCISGVRNVCGVYEIPAPPYIATGALARDEPGGQGVLVARRGWYGLRDGLSGLMRPGLGRLGLGRLGRAHLG